MEWSSLPLCAWRSYEELDSIHDGTVVSIGMKDGLPGNQVTSLLEDREGHLLVGMDDGL